MAIGGVQGSNMMSQIQAASALKPMTIPQQVDNDKASEGFEIQQNDVVEVEKASAPAPKDIAIMDIGKSMQANAAAIKAKVVQPQDNVQSITPEDQAVIKTGAEASTQKSGVLPPQLGDDNLAQLNGQERSQAQPVVREGTGGTTEVQARVNTERQQNNAVQLKLETSYGKKDSQVSSAVGSTININA